MMVFVWWLAAGLVLGIVEVVTVDLIFLMLAISAVLAAGAAALGVPLVGQVAVFTVSAVVLLLLVRPWARRHLARATPDIRTNAQSLIGREAVALTRLTGVEGRVRLAGETWSARTEDRAEVPAGTHVRVVRIDGATAVVGPLQTIVEPPPDQT
ncbi:NfeD family protein [Actinomyces provencensis]|uniref:NfeD family protein n=1 Tax=Actinomyces provencensis TaxID=1720198 RepID=UPI001E559F95|nr:NfeD family protein [Actinomyces provencensis]